MAAFQHMLLHYDAIQSNPAVPTVPLNVTLEAVTNTSFRVTWQPPIFPLFGLIEYYEIEIYSNFPELINTSANATVVTFNDLLPGTNYTVRVRAHTAVGGPFTEAELIQTLLGKFPIFTLSLVIIIIMDMCISVTAYKKLIAVTII